MKKIVTERENGSKRIQYVFEKETRTQQQFGPDVDINNIMKKYKKTGVINHLNSRTGVYADMTEIGSFAELHQKVIDARAAFEKLPSEIRTRFGHDPQKLQDYLVDPKNYEESIALGLRVKPEVERTEPQEPKTTKKTKSAESE